MKKKCLFFAGFIYLSLVSLELYSQGDTSDTSKPRHEFNIIVDDIFAKPLVIDPSEYNDYFSEIQNIPKVGLGYKVNYNHSAFRTKVSFGSCQNSTHSPVNDTKSDYSTVSTQLTLGYEWQKDINKLQIFYGLDLFIDYNSLTMKNSSLYNSISYHSKNSSNTTGFGTSPFLGVEYFVNPYLSFSTEINFTIESYKGKDKVSNQSNNNTSTDLKGFNTRIGPIGNIGINLHF